MGLFFIWVIQKNKKVRERERHWMLEATAKALEANFVYSKLICISLRVLYEFLFNIKRWSPLVVGIIYTTRPVHSTYVEVTWITSSVQFNSIDVRFYTIMYLAITYVYLLIGERGLIYIFQTATCMSNLIILWLVEHLNIKWWPRISIVVIEVCLNSSVTD